MCKSPQDKQGTVTASTTSFTRKEPIRVETEIHSAGKPSISFQNIIREEEQTSCNLLAERPWYGSICEPNTALSTYASCVSLRITTDNYIQF